MKVFLQAKNWQIFIILLILPIVSEILILQYFLPHAFQTQIMMYFAVMMIIYSIVFFSWLWSLGISLNTIVNEKQRMNIRLFKIFLIFLLIYVLATTVLMQIIYDTTSYPILLPAILFPVHLFSLFCFLYCIRLVAKSLKMAEIKKTAVLKEYLGDFFLIWFFPIGIWFIQPRINKLFKKS